MKYTLVGRYSRYLVCLYDVGIRVEWLNGYVNGLEVYVRVESR